MKPDSDSRQAAGARRLLVSAFGINSGGGLVLLNSLAAGLQGSLRTILLDERLLGRAPALAEGVTTQYVRRSFLARIGSLSALAASASAGDVLLCFNSLPPLRRTRARVVVYVQAPHFFGAHHGIAYSAITTVRIFLERVWFRLGVGNCDEIWVQTRTMADAMRARHPEKPVAVVPLVDDELLQTLAARRTASAAPRSSGAPVSFFYPADSVGHKNHANLLLAWDLLASEGGAPELNLTLEPHELRAIVDRVGLNASRLAGVKPLGRISREAVLQRLQSSSALIFPSLAETFGLPLLEAAALGIPVLAAERDFVRDVCTPQESFDPRSPRSIAMAVRRFMDGGTQEAPKYFSASEFVARLLS